MHLLRSQLLNSNITLTKHIKNNIEHDTNPQLYNPISYVAMLRELWITQSNIDHY